jgi:hypothetical protein
MDEKDEGQKEEESTETSTKKVHGGGAAPG